MKDWLQQIQNKENCFTNDIHVFIVGTKLDLLTENNKKITLLQQTNKIKPIIAKYHKTKIYERRNVNEMIVRTMFVEFAGYVSNKTKENVNETIETCISKAIDSLKCDKCGDLSFKQHQIQPPP